MFSQKKKSPKLIFVVEDNPVYAKSLEFFLKSKFDGVDVKTFPVGELCVDNLHLKPDFIIMDYFLNSKYFDAEDGLSILKAIKAKDPNAKTIVLSSQQDVKVALSVKDAGSMYLIKNDDAFENILSLIS
jgi:two-component system OmpR family response regulator